jgi:putative SOS response-associated peptidase YedK
MWERTFAVITVPANELVAPIHDRVLAILPAEQFPRWFSDEADPRDLLGSELINPSSSTIR